MDRGICCHVGGNIDFDGAGNLFLSTGDDTNPFASDGYSPIDDSPNRNPAFDARRSAGNTNDLRGKILRIRPEGRRRLHDPARATCSRRARRNTKPEIYAMGLRNPFRFAVNRKNGDVYVGDYSPDAGAANPLRGPAGHGRWMLIKQARRTIGWPYCVTPTCRTSTTTSPPRPRARQFNCNAPTNDSPYNTGLKRLPARRRSRTSGTRYDKSPLFPRARARRARRAASRRWAARPMTRSRATARRSGSRTTSRACRSSTSGRATTSRSSASTGAGWRRSGRSACRSTTRWTSSTARTARSTCSSTATATSPRTRTRSWRRSTSSAATTRRSSKVAADVTAGRAPLTVKFSSAGTADPDGDPIAYAWDFESDGKVDSTEANPTFTLRQERHLPREPAASPTAPGAARPPRSRCWSATPSRWSS